MEGGFIDEPALVIGVHAAARTAFGEIVEAIGDVEILRGPAAERFE